MELIYRDFCVSIVGSECFRKQIKTYWHSCDDAFFNFVIFVLMGVWCFRDTF